MIGTPYKYGGDRPETGFDCSGLVMYLLGLQGVKMPRTADDQFKVGKAVRRDHLQAGDLVFFKIAGDKVDHVGIVVDAGTAAFIYAPKTGGVVRVGKLNDSYWLNKDIWAGARRVF
jgi:cell wall-associated NlpC family hydrolase